MFVWTLRTTQYTPRGLTHVNTCMGLKSMPRSGGPWPRYWDSLHTDMYSMFVSRTVTFIGVDVELELPCVREIHSNGLWSETEHRYVFLKNIIYYIAVKNNHIIDEFIIWPWSGNTVIYNQCNITTVKVQIVQASGSDSWANRGKFNSVHPKDILFWDSHSVVQKFVSC